MIPIRPPILSNIKPFAAQALGAQVRPPIIIKKPAPNVFIPAVQDAAVTDVEDLRARAASGDLQAFIDLGLYHADERGDVITGLGYLMLANDLAFPNSVKHKKIQAAIERLRPEITRNVFTSMEIMARRDQLANRFAEGVEILLDYFRYEIDPEPYLEDLDSEDPEIVQRAAHVLERVGERAAPKLWEVFETGSEQARYFAAITLGHFGEHHVERMLQLLDSDDPGLVAYAAKGIEQYAFSSFGDRRLYQITGSYFVPKLKPLVDHEDPRVRDYAAQALYRYREVEAEQFPVPFFAQNLNHEDPKVRSWSAQSLGELMGPLDEAIEVLISGNLRSGRRVRLAAIEGLTVYARRTLSVLPEIQTLGRRDFLADEEILRHLSIAETILAVLLANTITSKDDEIVSASEEALAALAAVFFPLDFLKPKTKEANSARKIWATKALTTHGVFSTRALAEIKTILDGVDPDDPNPSDLVLFAGESRRINQQILADVLGLLGDMASDENAEVQEAVLAALDAIDAANL